MCSWRRKKKGGNKIAKLTQLYFLTIHILRSAGLINSATMSSEGTVSSFEQDLMAIHDQCLMGGMSPGQDMQG